MHLINCNAHQQCGCQADERVSTKSGWAAVKRTLKADHGTDQDRASQSAENNEFVTGHNRH
jgi:hypothetical protein